MAAIIESIVREFKLKDETLPDPDPAMSEAEVLEFYSGKYPELTTGFIKNRSEPSSDNKITYEIGFSVGEKS